MDLFQMAASIDWLVRGKVAQEPDCPIILLEKLATDKDYYVRYWVPQHPNCPIKLLEKLTIDEHHYVRSSVAQHPNCPIPSLEKLVTDEDYDVRSSVTQNPNCPEYIKTFFVASQFLNRHTIQPISAPFGVLYTSSSPNSQSTMNSISFSDINNFIAKSDNKVFDTPFFKTYYQSRQTDAENAQNDLIRFSIAAQVFSAVTTIKHIDKVWPNAPMDLYRCNFQMLESFLNFSAITKPIVTNWLQENMQPATFFHMMSKFIDKEGRDEAISLFNDTFSQLTKILDRKFDFKKTDKFRWRLREFHDFVSQYYLEKTTQNIPFAEIVLSEPANVDGFVIHQPKNTVELAIWAGKARNCVYSRAESVIGGNSYIFFIEKDGKLEYTCEVNKRETKKKKTVVFREIKNRTNRSLTRDEEEMCAGLLSGIIKK